MPYVNNWVGNIAMKIQNIPEISIRLNESEIAKVKYHIKKWQDSGRSISNLAKIAGVSRQQIYSIIKRNSYRLSVLVNLQLAFNTELINDKQLEQILSPIRSFIVSTKPY